MLGLIVAIVATTIFNVALNTIGGNFVATLDEVAWVATGYILRLLRQLGGSLAIAILTTLLRSPVTAIVFVLSAPLIFRIKPPRRAAGNRGGAAYPA